jgi:hypothetical protein
MTILHNPSAAKEEAQRAVSPRRAASGASDGRESRSSGKGKGMASSDDMPVPSLELSHVCLQMYGQSGDLAALSLWMKAFWLVCWKFILYGSRNIAKSALRGSIEV